MSEDNQKHSYSGLNEALKNAPQTWIPGLMLTLVKQGMLKRVWKVGRIHEFVKNAETTFLADGNPETRPFHGKQV